MTLWTLWSVVRLIGLDARAVALAVVRVEAPFSRLVDCGSAGGVESREEIGWGTLRSGRRWAYRWLQSVRVGLDECASTRGEGADAVGRSHRSGMSCELNFG